MKKVISALMAGAVTASMAVPAFAATAIQPTVYDNDGECIVGNDDDVYDTTPTISYTTTDHNSISIDGVVPGITMYIPLAKDMGEIVTDKTTAPNPDDAAIVAKMINLGSIQVDDDGLDDTAFYLKNDLASAVQAKRTPATKASLENVATKLNGKLVEVVSGTTPTTGVTLLNSKGDGVTGTVASNGDISGLDAYTEDKTGKVIVATAGEVAQAISDVKDDNATVTAADAEIGGKYYKITGDENKVGEAVKAAKDALKTTPAANYSISWNSLCDDDMFKFDLDKDDGSKYVKDIDLVYDKKLSGLNERTAFLKVMLNDSTTTDDLKSTGTVTFEAKDESSEENVTGETWADGKEIKIDYTFWINNAKKSGSDEDAETGDRVYFDPEDNEDNTFVWGDDRAALFFEGNDDADAFYCRMQTKADSSIYATYGDPVNADLWFYDFVGNPTVPSTSRATLTLGIAWDEDDDYTPNPEDCYIYEIDADGDLKDVTDLFTYDDENDGTTEIEGWTIKTRTLGTYVISDTELDTTVDEEVIEEVVDNDDADDADAAVTVDNGAKAIPNTGSSDMVGAAVVAAVASLAAAGAVAFKKASK